MSFAWVMLSQACGLFNASEAAISDGCHARRSGPAWVSVAALSLRNADGWARTD